MTCVHCDDLRRQLRERDEELEAWRGNRRDANAEEARSQRVERYRALLRGSGAAISAIGMLLLLVDRAGSVIRNDSLLIASREGSAWLAADEVCTNVVSVQLWKLRRGLRRLAASGRLPEGFGGASGGIETHWAVGYSLTIENAAALRQLAGDA